MENDSKEGGSGSDDILKWSMAGDIREGSGNTE